MFACAGKTDFHRRLILSQTSAGGLSLFLCSCLATVPSSRPVLADAPRTGATRPFLPKHTLADQALADTVQGLQVKLGPKHWERYGLKSWIEAAKQRLHHNVLAIALAHKLARVAWAVLNKGRVFACDKTDAVASHQA